MGIYTYIWGRQIIRTRVRRLDMSHKINFLMKDNLYEPVEKLKKVLDRDRSWIINEAVKQYIKENKDYLTAMSRLKDEDDEIISSEEMDELIFDKELA